MYIRIIPAFVLSVFGCDTVECCESNNACSAISENFAKKGISFKDSHLNNELCTDGVSYKLWDEHSDPNKVESDTRDEHKNIKYIILHYTANDSLSKTIESFYKYGVSAHFVTENDGTVNMTVNPDMYIAFHCGCSAWRDISYLNKYSVGIENINPGYVMELEEATPYKEIYGVPVKIEGSDRYWFKFSEKQIEATCQLVKQLMDIYKIPEFNVLTHADIRPGIKQDVGPAIDYKAIANKYGVGFYPKEDSNKFEDDIDVFSYEDYLYFIQSIGYSKGSMDYIEEWDDSVKEEKIIQSFQMHYSQTNISGKLTNNTKMDILNCVSELYSFESKVTEVETKKDEFFRKKINNFLKSCNDDNKKRCLQNIVGLENLNEI